jgi:outer membrane protein assembly factor BamB
MNRFVAWTSLVLLLPCSLWAGDPSLTFHHDNQRTGRTTNTGPATAGLLWGFAARSSFQASPVTAADGSIFLASTDECLYALTPEGQLRWTFLATASLYVTPAIASDGTLFFGDLAGWLYALTPDGGVRWTYQLTEGTDRRVIASPVVGPDGRSYWASWNNQVYALSQEGKLLWRIPAGGLISSSPSLDRGGNLYLASLDALNPSHIAVQKLSPGATLLWKFDDDLGVDRNRVLASPAIDEERGRVYVAASREEDGILYALNLVDGGEAFHLILPKGILSSPAFANDGTVYLGCLDGKLYAIDAASGKKKWSFSSEGSFALGSPTVDGAGRIYFGDSDGILYALTPSGQELWRFPTGANIVSAPVISDEGILYATSCDSRMYALGSGASGYGRTQVRQRLQSTPGSRR